ncbi:hypothetical protein [Legionella quateirensis]|uniref:Periplasmic protein n=1 Tax=Legionella quateirensis TaxID=45072 RepID=A0A378KVC2_9GAMM|nr:hypothetical protein [Legionella quateirensis]KTD47744.1 periplasmic protein [Legionella quateirensis]STY18493.1 periplasmic protein [Legionella quateirensis]
MMMRLVVLSWIIFFSSPIWSFTCFYTLAKDNCWTNYDVTVDVIDATNLKKVFSLTVPKGKSWGRTEFTCTKAQSLLYYARYAPVFWQSEQGKTYPALRNWTLPGKINPGDLAWTIPVCFPADFSQVPLPPDAEGNCKCDFSTIPKPKPKQ